MDLQLFFCMEYNNLDMHEYKCASERGEWLWVRSESIPVHVVMKQICVQEADLQDATLV
ncbi:hypothetical protein C823_004387 [Eubacterium plexicaudatum ASF492]|nr:hypothetical protein C823_004387 [Eubacterium plexicaudatum ASF492]